jgi:uncharacterized repeat protein (TIGR01451 family)
MTRRFLTAMATALILYGVVGARLGQAQQPAEPAKSAPADLPPDPGAEPETNPLPPAEPPPADVPAKGKAKAPGTPRAEPEPALPGEKTAPPGDPFGPETGPATPDAKADDVTRTQAPGGDGSTLPPAKEPQGGAPPAAGSAPKGDPFILPPDRLPQGANTVSLTVEVQAPPNANLNRPMKLKIFVKNSGVGPAMGILVHDHLPENLTFVKSEPPPTENVGGILMWQLDSLAGGAERVITVTATPTRTGDFDHAPTVSLRTGSKSRTMVKHPKLKVELTHEETGSVLKGRPVTFAVRVTNNGDGPARGVVLHANLTSGLKHEAGQSLEVVFKDYLKRDILGPGESEAIPLEVDAVSGGEQLCKVFADSPDVEETPASRAEAKVTVVEPKLVLELKGSTERYTDTVASYTLTVTNPGTATARNVVAAAWLPDLSGTLLDRTPSEVRFIAKERKLWWAVGDLEPNKTKEMKFNVRLGGVGLFKVEAAAKADTCAQQSSTWSTHVTGMPDIKCIVVARTRVLDVGEETIYEVRLSNDGSKEANNLSVKAVLTPNLRVEDTSGTDQKATSTTPERTDALFPAINLPPRGEQALTLRVKAMKAGAAKCTVTVIHDDFQTETSTTTKVSEPK